MIKKMRTNEGIQYKKLSAEEMKAKGILGRLIGVCADFNNSTRNGRKYSEQLWENVFNNPIMKEKIANGVCFGELGHPEDRTEVDMEKIAICLREQPVKNDKGQLCAIFDILDTPNGRILKTLCDYGSVLGVSSRGQGDLITDVDGNEAVDPDTYECECWDVVLVPAVESARMQYVKEDLDTNSLNMKRALRESLDKASEEERKIMKETLNELKINVNEAKKKDDEVEEETSSEETEQVEEVSNDETTFTTEEVKEVTQKAAEEVVTELEPKDTPQEEIEEVIEDKVEEVVNDAVEKKANEEEAEKEDETANDESTKEDDAAEEVDLSASSSESPVDAEVSLEVEPAQGEPITNECVNESCADKKENAEEEVKESLAGGDSTDIELIKNLQEALKVKSNLEKEVKELQEKLAVSDTKVSELTEENVTYKKGITRLSVICKSNKELKENLSKLEESVKEKEATIANQKVRIARLVEGRKRSVSESSVLNESVESKSAEIKSLNEQLTKANDEIKSLNEKIESENKTLTAKANELNESLVKEKTIKEAYKKLATDTINKYIDIRANLLGLSSVDVKRKLGSYYTLKDVDQVCEDLKSYQLNVSKLPFNLSDRKVTVKVNEALSKKPSIKANEYDDDDVDEDLIRLANLN